MRRGSVAEPCARCCVSQRVRRVCREADGAAVGGLDRRRVASGRAGVRRLGVQLGDVVEVDVVFGARGGSHYELQTPCLICVAVSIAGINSRGDCGIPMPG